MSWTVARAVARLYAALFGAVLGAVLVVFLVGDFADRLGAYLRHPAADVAVLYWNKLLVAAHQLAPAAMLLAAGAAVSTLRRRGEWTAMQALGMSRWVVALPLLLCTLGLSAALVAFDEWVVTGAGTRVDQLMVERFQRWGDYRAWYFPKQWFRVSDAIVHVRGESAEGRVSDVSLLEVDGDFHLARRLDARAMTSLGGARWALEDVEERRFFPDGRAPVATHARLEVALEGSTPDTFSIRTGRPELMPVRVLAEQLALRARVGLPTERYLLALHNRFAYPLTGCAAALLALMLALRPGRKGHLTLALVEGLGVIVGLFALLLAGKALVMGEHLAPSVAAWAPVLGLVAASAALWWRAEHPRALALR